MRSLVVLYHPVPIPLMQGISLTLGPGILSARLEISKFQSPPVFTSTLELGLQVCLGYQTFYWVLSYKFQL